MSVLKEKQEFLNYMKKYHMVKEAERYGDMLLDSIYEEKALSSHEATQLNLDEETKSAFINNRAKDRKNEAYDFFDKIQPKSKSLGKEIMEKFVLSKEELNSVYMQLIYAGQLN